MLATLATKHKVAALSLIVALGFFLRLRRHGDFQLES
jgi:hypothetical protein